MDYEVQSYVNRTLHGGVNQRLNARILSDIEAEELRNVDISVPGTRRKRLDPSNVDDLLEPTIPATPTSLADNVATAIAVCSTTVSWGTVIGASSYTLKLYAGGSCAGSPTQTVSVSSNFTSYTFTGLTGGTTYSWTVQAIGDGVDYANSNVSACASFTTDTITLDDILADGAYGTAYTGSVTASGGTASYTYAVTSGTLPTGLTLASNGNITGTPSVANTFNFTITATDANGCTGSRAYTIDVTSCPGCTATPAGTLTASVNITIPGGCTEAGLVRNHTVAVAFQGCNSAYGGAWWSGTATHSGTFNGTAISKVEIFIWALPGGSLVYACGAVTAQALLQCRYLDAGNNFIGSSASTIACSSFSCATGGTFSGDAGRTGCCWAADAASSGSVT